MKVTLNISEFKSKTFEDTEYPATSEETIQFIPMGKSGIHIKKENRGSFTEYCGGKVTDECIRKAKIVLVVKFVNKLYLQKMLEAGRKNIRKEELF